MIRGTGCCERHPVQRARAEYGLGVQTHLPLHQRQHGLEEPFVAAAADGTGQHNGVRGMGIASAPFAAGNHAVVDKDALVASHRNR